jgi:hypothetical protein
MAQVVECDIWVQSLVLPKKNWHVAVSFSPGRCMMYLLHPIQRMQNSYISNDVEFIKKMCFICTMECYFTTKQNEVMPFKTWNELNIIMLTNYFRHRVKYCMISHMCDIKKLSSQKLRTEWGYQRLGMWGGRDGSGKFEQWILPYS